MSKPKENTAPAGPERRFMEMKPTVVRYEQREGSQEEYAVVEGEAIVVGVRTDLGWFDERIEPGAFDEALASSDLDCRCLFNHNSSLVLARKRAANPKVDTLELYKNEKGNLAYRYTTPDRSYAKDLQNAIAAGDVSGCSFQFTIREQSWEFSDDPKVNDLRKVIRIGKLLDVGPVTFPAYPDTTVAKRSYDQAKEDTTSEQDEKPRESGSLKRSLIDPIINSY